MEKINMNLLNRASLDLLMILIAKPKYCAILKDIWAQTSEEINMISKCRTCTKLIDLIGRAETDMLLVKPVLTHTALYHLYLFLEIWIWIGAIAGAVYTFEVVII